MAQTTLQSSANFVVLQHGHGTCRDMMRVSFPRTNAWCKQHGLRFIGSARREAPGHHYFWDKPALFRRVLPTLPDGTCGLWMDSDCFVTQPDVTPVGILPDGFDIGMRFVQWNFYMDTPRPQRPDGSLPKDFAFYQAGVIFWRNTPNLRSFFDMVWSMRDDPRRNPEGETAPEDEWAINKIIEDTDFPCFDLPLCWNTPHAEHDPVIRAFHGWNHQRVIEKLIDEKCAMKRRIRMEV